MELIASGRASQVYALDERRVLRRSANDVGDEVRLMRHLHRHGYPVPEVFDASGRDLVMERLHGPTLAETLIDGRTEPIACADILFGLHERLHLLEAPDWLGTSSRGVDLRDTGERPVILHLDIHPANVILTEHGPYLVDWTNAAAGDPDVDIAVSWMIMAGADLAALGVPDAVAEPARAGVLGPLREGLSETAMTLALRYRLPDPSVDEAELRRVRTALGR